MSTATLTLVTLPGWMHPPEALDALRRALGQAFPDRRLRWVPLPWQTALRQDDLAAQFAPSTGPCLVLGWSLGALAALALAAQAPPALEGLLLLGATARLLEDAAQDYPGVAPARIAAMRRKLRADPATLFRNFFRLCTQPAEMPASHVEAFLRHALAQDPQDAAAGLEQLAKQDLRPLLPAIHVPVALLHGAADAVVPAAQARFLAQRLPRASLRILPGQGHLVPQNLPEDLLPDLLREILPAGSLAP